MVAAEDHDDDDEEVVADHTVVRGYGWPRGQPSAQQVTERNRMPVSAVKRLHRVVGIPSQSQYRSGSSHNSSYANLH